jgi:vacuolar iron transporter family protein
MPTIPHIEKHFTATETVRDVVIGMADGLTVPFALAAGLSAAVSNTSVIVTAGLAEIAAGAIAMGLGGYLAARTDAQHFASEQAREEWEIDNKREFEINEVRQVFAKYGLTGGALDSVVASITSDRKRWTDFMMRFELGLERPDPKRAPISAATIAISYLVGGLIPLLPYMLTSNLTDALKISVLTTGVALLFSGA